MPSTITSHVCCCIVHYIYTGNKVKLEKPCNVIGMLTASARVTFAIKHQR